MIAKEIGLTTDQYDCRVNRAGVAVSGDVHLHTDSLYVAFDQSCCGIYLGFMYRSVANRRDFTGGTNQWMRCERLTDIPSVVETFKKTAKIS